MKTLFLPLFAIFIFKISVICQIIPVLEPSEKHNFNAGFFTESEQDSKIMETGYSERNISKSIDGTIWVYDSLYHYIGNSQDWIQDFRLFVLDRNTKGYMTKERSEIFIHDKWVNFKKRIYDYDVGAEENEDELTTLIWDWENEKWGDTINYRKFKDKLILVNMDRIYSLDKNTFTSGTKIIHKYNNDNNKILELTLTWSEILQKWEYFHKESIDYISKNEWESSSFRWDIINKVWVLYYVHHSERDDQNHEIFASYKKRVDSLNMVVNSTRFYATYNDKGQETSNLSQKWSVEDGVWINVEKTNSSFESSGHLTGKSTYKWDKIDSFWQKKKNYINTFNADSTRNTEIVQIGSLNDTLWHNNKQNLYFYKPDSFIVIREKWSEANEKWNLNSKLENIYNDSHKTIKVTGYIRNIAENRWDNDFRVLSDYDTSNNLVKMRYQRWENDMWENITKSNYDYNEIGVKIKHTSYVWDKANQKWKNRKQTIRKYNDAGKNTLIITKKGDTTGDLWENVDKYIFYWSSYETSKVKKIENTIAVFPNPAKDYLYLAFEKISRDKKVFIYSLSSKLIMEDLVYGNQIDISSLKTGIYFIKIDTNGKTYNSKFVVE